MDEEAPVRVPHRELSPSTLCAVVEDYCSRDGTDYGESETPLERRVAQVMAQLDRGAAHILFEATSGTLRIVSTDELEQHPLPPTD